MAWYSGVSGACWPRPQGLVGSNAAWPPTPRLTARQSPENFGYFPSSNTFPLSKTWAVAIEIMSAVTAIVPIVARISIAVLPVIADLRAHEANEKRLQPKEWLLVSQLSVGSQTEPTRTGVYSSTLLIIISLNAFRTQTTTLPHTPASPAAPHPRQQTFQTPPPAAHRARDTPRPPR